MIAFLRPLSAGLPLSAADYCNCIQSVITINARFQERLNLLIDEGLTEKKRWDLAKFVELYQNLNNHTHKFANRGYTPDELFAQSPRGVQLRQRLAPENQMSFFEEPPHKPKLTIGGAPSRNGPCPCGSGRKYKNCCGKEKK